MSPNDEATRPHLQDSVAPGPPDAVPATGGTTTAGNDGGVLDRFPEAVAAEASIEGTPSRPDGARGFRVLLYAALGIGAVTGLSLIAAWVLQAFLAGSYVNTGGDYFGSGLEAEAARDLLSIPVGGFIVVLLLCFAGMCVGAWGVQRVRNGIQPSD